MSKTETASSKAPNEALENSSMRPHTQGRWCDRFPQETLSMDWAQTRLTKQPSRKYFS